MNWPNYLTIFLVIIAVVAITLFMFTDNATFSDFGIFMQIIGFTMLLKEFVNFGYSETHPKYKNFWVNRHSGKISILFIIFGLLFTSNIFPLSIF